jgi:2-polyprenyl-3-methyl-5-hydroxy-6-metoxy-1,4-benzoquinol methylase
MSKCRHTSRKITLIADKVTLFKCEDCGVTFSDKCKKGFDPSRVYNNYYRNEIAGRFLFGVEYVVRVFRFFRAFKIFTIVPRAKSILDIGSGRGFMLYFLKKYYGYTYVAGTQIEKNSYEFSRNKLGLNIYNRDLLKIDFKERKFDLVTIWHVLEHIPDPEGYMLKIRTLLNKGGSLIIEVPNYDSWTRSLTGKYWLGLDLKYHLFFFNKKSLTSILKKYGFKIRTTRSFSLEYSTFISVQSIVSRITGTDQSVFNFLQNGKFNFKIIFHLVLFLALIPFCLITNLVLYFTDKGEILLVIAKK